MNSGQTMLDSLSRELNNGEANPVSEQERELAQEALANFTRANYAACSAILEKLETLRPQDLKVTHNKIISDFFRSSEPHRTEVLLKSLRAIDVQQPTHSQDFEDIEKSMLRYNQAIVLFHLRKYQAALDIINSIFTLTEPLEESFVYKICLILLELQLILGKQDIALTLMHFIECQYTSSPDSSQSELDEHGLSQKHDSFIKFNAKPVVNVTVEADQKKDKMDVIAEAFRIKLFKIKMRIYLKILQVKNCKREWNTLVALGMTMDLSTIFLKANLEFLNKNYKKAMKILNTINSELCPDFKTCGESIAVLYYNNIASLHFAMGKPNLACFYLTAALNENKKAIESVKPKIGTSNSTIDSSTKSAVPLYCLGKYKQHELVYSLGVSLLYTGQATKAFNCFVEASQVLHKNPRLWLRMAECCIMCHKPSNKMDFDIPARRKDIVEKVVGDNNGNGISRKFVLTSSLSKNYVCQCNAEGLSSAIPQPTLEYGILCLKNAMFLLPAPGKENLDETNSPLKKCAQEGLKLKTSLNQPQTLLASLSPSIQKTGNHNIANSPMKNIKKFTTVQPSQYSINENLNLRISVLAASSYISLCLGDYVLALEHAKSLLSIKNLPGAHWLLGNLYAAESLIFLDRVYEALEHLKPESLQNMNTYYPIEEVVGEKENVVEEVIEQKPSKVSWYPSNIATAKSILRYNLAVAYAIRGELDKSGEILKQIWTSKGPDCDVPIHVIMLALYIELQLGHVEIARSLIKQHYCQEPQQ